ncbi:MAG TPA: radical SAM protein [Anaerolineae bacterium]|nr:radical SAM protein [Anaerolineae bacterium]HQH39101.1 radical SAM protein [Anaerolineae bacterium]
MKILLLFPPHWTPAMPHLALPTLTAYLRAHGVEVIQRDLNVEFFDALLTRSALEDVLARLQEQARCASGVQSPTLRSALTAAPRLIAQVEGAKALFRSPDFFAGEASLVSFLTLAQSLDLAALPFTPTEFSLTNFRPPVYADSSSNLLHIVDDPQHNIFLDFFRRHVLPDIVREQPDIVGISIPTLDQMIAGMTLGHLIKAAGLPCHVTVGGPHISMLREQLPKVPAMFRLFDSAVIFDGENALLRLAETVAGDGDLSQVPNLIYNDRGSVRRTPVETGPHPDLLPDFDGLPLERYLVPTPVLPLLSAHGCYHGRCGFCNVGYGGPGAFSPLDADLVVEHMLALRTKYGARHIFFADEAITPHNLKGMSTRLAEAGAPVHWCGCVRFDAALTRDLLERMAQSGCRMLLFGLETAAERTIRRMDKGTKPAEMSRILRDSTAAGIWNHTFFFFGFPGETMEDAQETVNFVYAHQDAIHSASPGAFLLERYAPVARAPGKYGVTIHDDPHRDLAIYFDYDVASGLDEPMADTLASRLIDVLPEKKFGQFYIHDSYRFLYAGDLHEKGQALPLWLA